MDKDFFMNAGIPPPQPLQFETTMPVPWTGLSCPPDQSFLDPNSSMDHHYSNFESAFSSMVSSPAAAATTTSGLSNEAFVLRELIGKLGGAGSSTAFPPPATTTTSPFNDSSYRTPLSSPKLQLPFLDQMNMPNLGTSLPPAPPPPLPALSSDPGFAERAAKFSCFGSRSFNGRTSPFGVNNAELGHRSNTTLMGNGKLPRVSSSPALKQGGSPLENKNSGQPGMEIKLVNGLVSGSEKKLSKLSGSGASSNEESSVSEQIPSGENGPKTSNEMSSRKRKAVSRAKSKENGPNSAKGGGEGDDDGSAKRSKPTEIGKNETKMEEEAGKGGSNDESEKQKANQKPPEPPKDYIHVRARRGQATDSHSLAERVRREKISERMKLLQDLVPGCNKVTGKALMLDEIINYVQSLQRQVEFLSMKLASVNPGLDFNMDNLLSKDQMFPQNAALPQQMYPLDSAAPTLYHHQPQQNGQQFHDTTNASTGVPLSQCPVDPLPLGVQLPSADGFSESLPQFPAFSEDDLHSIVHMGFVNFPVNQPSDTRVER